MPESTASNQLRIEKQQLKVASRKEFTSRSMVKILKLRSLRKTANLVSEPTADKHPQLGKSIGDPTRAQLRTVFQQALEKAVRLVSS